MKNRRIGKFLNVTAVGWLVAIAPSASADSFKKEISKGNQSYRQGKYEEAARHYRSAEIDRPGSPVAAYNLGTALVTGKNYEEALPKLGEAAAKLPGAEQALAHYNIGNGLFGAGKYEEAVGAYKKALEIDPNDRDAKYNLELAQKKLEEQKQNQKQNQKKKEKNEKKDKGGSSDSDSTRQKQNQSQPQNQEQQKSPDQKEQQKMARPKQQMTKEEAERILAALKNEEMKVKKQKKADAIPVVGGRDW